MAHMKAAGDQLGACVSSYPRLMVFGPAASRAGREPPTIRYIYCLGLSWSAGPCPPVGPIMFIVPIIELRIA